MDRNERLGLMLVIGAACMSVIVFSAIALCERATAQKPQID